MGSSASLNIAVKRKIHAVNSTMSIRLVIRNLSESVTAAHNGHNSDYISMKVPNNSV
jgi:hypothetical protein